MSCVICGEEWRRNCAGCNKLYCTDHDDEYLSRCDQSLYCESCLRRMKIDVDLALRSFTKPEVKLEVKAVEERKCAICSKEWRRNCAGCPDAYCSDHCDENLKRCFGSRYCVSCIEQMKEDSKAALGSSSD